MKVYVEIEMEWSDVRVINIIADRIGLDPESTFKLIIRKGIESIIKHKIEKTNTERKKDKGGEK